MRRALAGLLALALVAAAPVALARTKHTTSKQRCAHKSYARQHARQCARFRKRPHSGYAQTQVAPATPGPQPPLPAGLPPDAPAPTTAAPTATAPVTRIGVVAREFSLTLSRTSVSAGAVGVQLQNFGQDPHNLRVERVDGTSAPTDFATTEPGSLQSQTVTLAPGAYKLYCTLPGHDAAGMHATLIVG